MRIHGAKYSLLKHVKLLVEMETLTQAEIAIAYVSEHIYCSFMPY